MKSFAEEQIISWLDQLGLDGSIEFRRSPIDNSVDIRIGSNGSMICESITLNVIRKEDYNVITETVDRGVDRLLLKRNTQEVVVR